MNQILRCDWLPERTRWSYLARSGLTDVSREKNFPESQIIILCSVKMAGYWPRFFACLWTSTPSRSINKTRKKDLDQHIHASTCILQWKAFLRTEN